MSKQEFYEILKKCELLDKVNILYAFYIDLIESKDDDMDVELGKIYRLQMVEIFKALGFKDELKNYVDPSMR